MKNGGVRRFFYDPIVLVVLGVVLTLVLGSVWTLLTSNVGFWRAVWAFFIAAVAFRVPIWFLPASWILGVLSVSMREA